jgi:hypothetical protein
VIRAIRTIACLFLAVISLPAEAGDHHDSGYGVSPWMYATKAGLLRYIPTGKCCEFDTPCQAQSIVKKEFTVWAADLL